MADRSVRVRISAITADLDRALRKSGANAQAFAKDLDTADSRLGNLVQTALALSPALVPITAAAVPALAAVASGFTAAATGAGVAVLAFQGVGSALDALNSFHLDPTEENLDKVKDTLSALGPVGQNFVFFLQELRAELQPLQDLAQEGLLPGVEEGIEDLLTQMPIVERVVTNVSGALGDLAADGGEALTDPFWQEFFTFLATDAADAIDGIGRGLGNLGKGFAGMLLAFDPMADDFGNTLLDLTEDFSQFGQGLRDSEDFREFVNFIEESAPQAAETLGAVGNAIGELVQATAPVGQAALPLIEGVADTFATIADSPVGPVLIGAAAGLSAISRAIALYNVANGAALVSLLGGVGKDAPKAAKAAATADVGMRAAAAGVGLFALSLTDLDEKAGLANTASFALLGAIAGPYGAAVGAGIGLAKDFADANDDLADALDRASDSAADPLGFSAQREALTGLSSEIGALEDRYEGAVGTFARATNPLNDLPAKLRIAYGGALDDLDAAEDRARDLGQAFHENQVALAEFHFELERGREADSTRDIIEDLENIDEIAAKLGPVFADLGIDTEKLLSGGREGWDQALRAVSDYMTEQDSIPGRTSAVVEAFAGLSSQLETTEDKASALASALDDLLNPMLDQDEATIAWKRALTELEEGLSVAQDENGNLVRSLDSSTLAGQDNIDTIRGGVEALIKKTEADAKAGESAAVLAGRVRAGRRDLLDAAEAAGFNRDKVEQLLDTYGLTPDLVSTIVQAVGTGKAKSETEAVHVGYRNLPNRVLTNLHAADAATPAINTVDRNLRNLDGKTATVTITSITRNISESIRRVIPFGPSSAEGNLFRSFDMGDVADAHQPQIAPAGAWRVWAEPETGGEAYIPLADDHRRPRAVDIWERTGEELGVRFVKLAEGGLLRSFAGGDLLSTATARSTDIAAFVSAINKLADAEKELADAQRRHARFESLSDQVDAAREKARQAKSEVASRLDILQAESRTNDLHKSLNARGDNRLRGLDRTVAQAELREAQRELTKLRLSDERYDAAVKNRDRLVKQLAKSYGTAAQEAARLAQAEERASVAGTLAGAGDLFGGFASAGSAQAQVDRAIRDIGEYGSVIAALRAKGASPFILEQIAAKAQSGDFRSAIRLGKALLASPEALARLNASTSTLQALSSQVAGITTDPRFLSDGRWNPMGIAPKIVQVQVAADPSEWMTEIKRQITFEVRAELAKGAS